MASVAIGINLLNPLKDLSTNHATKPQTDPNLNSSKHESWREEWRTISLQTKWSCLPHKRASRTKQNEKEEEVSNPTTFVSMQELLFFFFL